ncbi:MAG: DUF3843 family protein [Phaeodactylibacter sp.]|nr:DUF3843 family protein [Phaeodactylibacter sp.]
MKRRSSTRSQGLTITDWMKYRPYKIPSAYDSYYLKLANSALAYLDRPETGFKGIFRREHLKELAVLLTCHFEDFICEIGLWRALVRKHQELYGKYLPLFDLEEYDPNYLNPQDFAYLIWHHLGKMAQKTLMPQGRPLLAAADHFYDFFETRIDEAPATDFYDRWLDISPDIYFFDLKLRLNWMAFNNYITGPEFSQGFQEAVDKLDDEENELLRQLQNRESLIYGMQDDFLLKKSSSWCALTAPDWLAEVARCPDELRPDIRRLFQRVQGIFLYEGHDKKYYRFQFVRSGRLFPVHRESVDLDVAKMKAGVDAASFAIVNWRGEWWLSGVYMGWDGSPKDLDKLRIDPKGVNFYGWTEEQKQQIYSLTAEMEEAFLSYFGERLVFFKNEKEMARAMEAHNAWWNENKTKQLKPGEKRSRYAEMLAEESASYDDIDLGGGSVAAYYSPGEGVLMSSLIPRVVKLLQKKKLKEEEYPELFYSFFHEFSPVLAHYIAERYPLENLRFPLGGDADFVRENFDFFLRYYNPGDFREALPLLSLLPEE